MWFLRKMLRVSWTAKKSNKTVFRQADTKTFLINRILKPQAIFFAHVMRRKKLEILVTTGIIEGKTEKGKTA